MPRTDGHMLGYPDKITIASWYRGNLQVYGSENPWNLGYGSNMVACFGNSLAVSSRRR
jgi:hypothetical protein